MNFSTKPGLRYLHLSILTITTLVIMATPLLAYPKASPKIPAAGGSTMPVSQAKDKTDSESLWIVDFDKALALAKTKNLPLLVDFSGSDWCKWCIILDKEVFKTEEFKTWAKKNIVMCLVDMPKNRALLSQEQFKKNMENGKKYKVEGYPTVLLLDSDGIEFARTGYQKGGAQTYITHLESLLSNRGWREKLATIDTLEKEKQVILGTYILNNQINSLDAADGTKVATILFNNIKDEQSPEKTKAATVLALDETKPVSPLKAEAVNWMKKRAAEGDKKPYSVYLFIRNSIDFAKLGQLIQKNPGAILASKEIKTNSEAVLAGIKVLEEYMDDPMMKKQVDTRKILSLGAIGKTEEALKLADLLFAAEPNGAQMTEQLKTYIKSIK